MTDEEKHTRAIAAASQGAEAVAELLRYAREGDQDTFSPFCCDPIEALLDAAKMAIEITCGDELGERGQIYGAIVKHNEGWA